jgi:hypothetical protein
MENSTLAGTAAMYVAIVLFLAILLLVFARVAWFYVALLLLSVSGRWRRRREPQP